jgi:hypothetical protein
VSSWKAHPAKENAPVTPGRISTVFFFPKESFERLKNKDPGWGKNTVYGRLSDSFLPVL